MFFIYFHPYFDSYISFRQEYFSFRPYFCQIADIQGIIYLPLPFHQSLFRKIKFITKQSTASFPLYLIWFAAQSSCIRQSRTAVSVGSQRSLRQFDGECTANPRRLQFDSTETALRIEKFLNRLKKFCSLATPLRMRWDSLRMHCECAANALRLRGVSENWKMFNLQWSRRQICQSVRAAYDYCLRDRSYMENHGFCYYV